MVIENGANEDEALAALLHDAIEDQAQRFGGATVLWDLLRDRFGKRVVEIVDACTDSETNPRPPWRERKEAFIARLSHLDDSGALVVSCDKLRNARSLLDELHDMGNRLWDRFKGGRYGSLWYYRSVVQALRSARAPLKVINELERVVGELEQLAKRS